MPRLEGVAPTSGLRNHGIFVGLGGGKKISGFLIPFRNQKARVQDLGFRGALNSELKAARSRRLLDPSVQVLGVTSGLGVRAKAMPSAAPSYGISYQPAPVHRVFQPADACDRFSMSTGSSDLGHDGLVRLGFGV